MRRIFALAGGFTVAAAYFALSALPAIGADSGTVNARITVAAACLTVNDGGGLTFASAGFSRPGAASSAQTSNFTVSNCSAGSETVLVRGTDATAVATGSAAWTLIGEWTVGGPVNPCSATPATNSFVLDLDPSNPWGGFVTKVNKTWTNLSGGLSKQPDLRIFMPCIGSNGAGETLELQVIFTASA